MLFFAKRAIKGVARYAIDPPKPPIETVQDLYNLIKSSFKRLPGEGTVAKQAAKKIRDFNAYILDFIILVFKATELSQKELVLLAIKNANTKNIVLFHIFQYCSRHSTFLKERDNHNYGVLAGLNKVQTVSYLPKGVTSCMHISVGLYVVFEFRIISAHFEAFSSILSTKVGFSSVV